MGIQIEVLPKGAAVWSALAASESRDFRADLAGKPRLHGFDFNIKPPTAAQSINTASTPWGFPVSHAPGERPLWMNRMVADPTVVIK